MREEKSASSGLNIAKGKIEPPCTRLIIKSDSVTEPGKATYGIQSKKEKVEELDDTLSFSFKYFKQKENFGLSEVSKEWLADAFESLARYSREGMNFLKNPMNNYHRLFFKEDREYATIHRNYFDYLRKEFGIEFGNGGYELNQARLSNQEGRFIFFFDDSTCNVVLLDPHHNAYLSKPKEGEFYESKITPCHSIKGESYAVLTLRLENFCEERCNTCDHSSKLRDIIKSKNDGSYFYFVGKKVDYDEDFRVAINLLAENGHSYSFSALVAKTIKLVLDEPPV